MCGFPVFPAQPPEETKAAFNSEGRGRIFGQGTGLHTLGFPRFPCCLLQVHKFLNRNRDHLDPAAVEMLAQSQLQVPLPISGPAPPLCPLILPFLPGHSCSRGLPSRPWHLGPRPEPARVWVLWAGPPWLPRVGAGWAMDKPPLSPQLVGSLFQEAEPQGGGGPGKPTLASRFQQSLGDLLARLGR